MGAISIMLVLAAAGLAGTAHAHTVDSVGEYRVEIGWMNEPVVSGETNAIELYVSPLEPGMDLEEQVFRDGVGGLRKEIKLQLVYKGESITLPFSPDHDVPGKYYAFVDPTVSGFYQANILGDIRGTPISLSMHPPKVEERSHIEFPEPADSDVAELAGIQEGLVETVDDLAGAVDGLREEVAGIRGSDQGAEIGYAGIGMGIAGIAVAAAALARSRH